MGSTPDSNIKIFIGTRGSSHVETETPIIKDATVFTYKYQPTILHREEQIKELSFRMYEHPAKSTVIYGLSGTGKTLITKHISKELIKNHDVRVCYVRLKGASTEYKAINEVAMSLMNEKFEGRSPGSIYSRIFNFLKHHEEKQIIFVLDEIDSIKQNYDTFLDAFLRPGENRDMGEKEVSVILISNDMTFPKELSIGTQSSFACMDKLVFVPYNANQLLDILYERAEKGLNVGTYEEYVIPLCAAYGAQEHGDARRTIELLGKAAYIAERQSAHSIQEQHVKQAYEIIEFEGAAQVLITLPTQSKLVALAISNDSTKKESTTVSIYEEYKKICQKTGLTVLTQRRIADILVEFSNLGLITSSVKYRGQEGRSKYVQLAIPQSIINKVVLGDFHFKSAAENSTPSEEE